MSTNCGVIHFSPRVLLGHLPCLLYQSIWSVLSAFHTLYPCLTTWFKRTFHSFYVKKKPTVAPSIHGSAVWLILALHSLAILVNFFAAHYANAVCNHVPRLGVISRKLWVLSKTIEAGLQVLNHTSSGVLLRPRCGCIRSMNTEENTNNGWG